MKNKIIIPTDLTEAAAQAVRQATVIAMKTGASLALLHVVNDKTEASSASEPMEELAAQVRNAGVKCEILIKEGNIFDVIPHESCEHDYDLMVIGTHGVKGFRQMLLGADMLKLVSRIPIPVLVVQKESPLIESFSKIILPVSSHEAFQIAVDSAIQFTDIYQSTIYFYSIHKAGFDWPEQLLKNIEETASRFESKGIKMIRIKEDQNLYSMGYAKQTLKYAESIQADFICMMSTPSKEYYYFAQSDKETMIMNDIHMPVLFAGGRMHSSES